jgi:hypothetical protein
MTEMGSSLVVFVIVLKKYFLMGSGNLPVSAPCRPTGLVGAVTAPYHDSE